MITVIVTAVHPTNGAYVYELTFKNMKYFETWMQSGADLIESKQELTPELEV